MTITVEVDQDSIRVGGPVRVFKSSDWAERGFCEVCGSSLWYGLLGDGSRHLSAGLFDNAGGGTLVQEYFSDHCPEGYRLAGDHERLTRAETFALFAPAEGDQ